MKTEKIQALAHAIARYDGQHFTEAQYRIANRLQDGYDTEAHSQAPYNDQTPEQYKQANPYGYEWIYAEISSSWDKQQLKDAYNAFLG